MIGIKVELIRKNTGLLLSHAEAKKLGLSPQGDQETMR